MNDFLARILEYAGRIMVTKGTKTEKVDVKAEKVDAEIDVISKRILSELESASSKDLSDARYARMMLRLADVNYAKKVIQQIGSVVKPSSEAESDIEKRAVVKVLLFSTWLHRLYFIIRSFLMSMIFTAGTVLFVLYLVKINAFVNIEIGIFMFVVGLVVTRLFDTQITNATNKIVELLANHRAVRDFIMKHF